MDYFEVMQLINDICKKESNFEERVKILQQHLGNWDVDSLTYHLSHAGVIPEVYEHDSSEEKLYAKYCDILICAFFKLYGMESEIIRVRGDFPDVRGNFANKYKIVADAKAFRLSRTALNPKDYKISALGRWREKADADYSCLVGSFFPKGRSRVFQEAVIHKVTLLSYTHLQLILADPKWTSIDLKPLWEIPNSLSNAQNINSDIYWGALNNWLLNNVKPKVSLRQIEKNYAKNILEEGRRQISYLEDEKKRIGNLSKEELINRLCKEVDSKISQIQARINELSAVQDLSEYF
jgi:type II restriction enzyme